MRESVKVLVTGGAGFISSKKVYFAVEYAAKIVKNEEAFEFVAS
jgi:dTDP-D-glucose 4,6-dehydratase